MAQIIIGHIRAHVQDITQTHDHKGDHIQAHMSLEVHSLGHMRRDKYLIQDEQIPHGDEPRMDQTQDVLGLYGWNIIMS